MSENCIRCGGLCYEPRSNNRCIHCHGLGVEPRKAWTPSCGHTEKPCRTCGDGQIEGEPGPECRRCEHGDDGPPNGCNYYPTYEELSRLLSVSNTIGEKMVTLLSEIVGQKDAGKWPIWQRIKNVLVEWNELRATPTSTKNQDSGKNEHV